MTQERFVEIKKCISDKLEYEPSYVAELVEHVESTIEPVKVHEAFANISIDS